MRKALFNCSNTFVQCMKEIHFRAVEIFRHALAILSVSHDVLARLGPSSNDISRMAGATVRLFSAA